MQVQVELFGIINTLDTLQRGGRNYDPAARLAPVRQTS